MCDVEGRFNDRILSFLRRADEESIRGDVIGALFLLGATLSTLSVILPHPDDTDMAVAWGVVISATIVGTLLIARSARMTTPQLHVAVMFGSVLINTLIVASGVATGIYTAMFPWVVLVAVNFFSLRAAIIHYAWLMFGYAVALGLTESASGFSPATRWMAAAFGLAVTGGATAWLVYRRHIAEESRRRFLALSEEMLCAIDTDDCFVQISPSWGSRLGYTEAQLRAQPFTELVHPMDRPTTETIFAELRNGADPATFENRYRRSDGSWQRMIWRATFVEEDGLIYARLSAIRGEAETAPIRPDLREVPVG